MTYMSQCTKFAFSGAISAYSRRLHLCLAFSCLKSSSFPSRANPRLVARVFSCLLPSQKTEGHRLFALNLDGEAAATGIQYITHCGCYWQMVATLQIQWGCRHRCGSLLAIKNPTAMAQRLQPSHTKLLQRSVLIAETNKDHETSLRSGNQQSKEAHLPRYAPELPF